MNQLTIINHNNQHILTTAQIAEAYESDSKVITQNFNRNKSRYIEGKHFYCLEGEELRDFKATIQIEVSPSINKLYLWTEKGALLHAKSLGTDKAWQVYEDLVDNYFQTNDLKQFKNLSPELKAIIMQDEKIQKVETRVDKLEDNIHVTRSQQKQLRFFVNEVVVKVLGSKHSTAYKLLKNKAFSQIWKDYQNYFNLASYLDTPKIRFQDALNFINSWKPSQDLSFMIIGANTQMTLEA